MNCDGVDHLPVQVAGVEVEAELGPVADRLQGALGGVDVEGDLGRVDLQRELDAALLEDVEDRVPSVGEQLESVVDGGIRHRGERVEQMPDGRAGEAVDHLDAQLLRGPRRVLHLLDGPLGLLLRVAADVRRHPVIGPRVVVVEHELAGQVVRDRPALQPVLAQELVAALAIARVAQGLLDVEMVAPAGQLDAVIAPLAGLLGDDFQRQVGPLAGEEGHGSCHWCVLPMFDSMRPRSCRVVASYGGTAPGRADGRMDGAPCKAR